MADYTVKPGDCFASIARANNFFDYLTLYNHADNAAVKAKFPNPNTLVEGEVVKIPAKKAAKIQLVLDGDKTIFIKRKATKLRVVVTRVDKSVYPRIKSSLLTVGSKSNNALPDGTGLIEIADIDPAAKTATLKIVLEAPPAPAPPGAAPAAASPPPNPPPIVPAHFVDKAVEPDGDVTITWTFKLGELERHDVVRGTLQRLFNMGWEPPLQKTENDATRKVVKAYQAFAKATVDGNATAVNAGVKTLHDAP